MQTEKGRKPQTIWQWEEVGHTQDAKREQLGLDRNDPFGTPKPERLMERVVTIASNPGDLVLDSFLGSGTTAAVAQKMGRRFIGIEVGDHAVTHAQPRLAKVGDGDRGGVSQAQGWTGGGGFRFYRLGPQVFGDDGRLTDGIAFPVLAAHVWFSETAAPLSAITTGPLLGIHSAEGSDATANSGAVALLYNGILGDKRPQGGNVLTRSVLSLLREAIAKTAPDFDGNLTVYGERSALTPATLARENITFKQTPYDVKARR
ncbi:MAG: DNA methyltransferase [Alphaproteobacteria bacterium]